MSEKLKKLTDEADELSRKREWGAAVDKWDEVIQLARRIRINAQAQNQAAAQAQYARVTEQENIPLSTSQPAQKDVWDKLTILAKLITALALLIGSFVGLWHIFS